MTKAGTPLYSSLLEKLLQSLKPILQTFSV